MLLKFGARNFLSFKEGIEISFEFSNKVPRSISKGRSAANLLCVKGANGSGKSNALKIISFLNSFCCDSFSYKPDAVFAIDSHFHDEEPIDLFCEFKVKETRYYYEASMTTKEILSEKLIRKKKRQIEVFERTHNDLVNCIDEYKELKNIKLRSNASIISTAHQYEIEKIAPIYNFFGCMTSNVGWSGILDLTSDYHDVSKLYKDHPEFFQFTKDIIKKCDLGIEDIQIQESNEEEGKKIYFPVFKHKTKAKTNALPYQSQSSGTKALYNILVFYKNALAMGGVLILDEFDISFHPDILPILIGSFEDPKLNKNKAQMIFTTHNTDIMNQMGKYRTYLINQENSESYGYRLDEVPGDLVRNDRPITPVYKSGKIGGVPRI